MSYLNIHFIILITSYYKANKRSIVLDKPLTAYITIPRGVTSSNEELAAKSIRISALAYYIGLDISDYIE
jgi:hypothetical protein